jgi:hypothetical protein
VDNLLAQALGGILEARNLAAGIALGAFAGLVLDVALRARSGRAGAFRVLAFASLGIAALALGCLYAFLAHPWLRLGVRGTLAAALGALLVAGPVVAILAAGRPAPPGGIGSWLGRAGLLLVLVVVAAATLLTAGFVSLTEDQPVLLVDITGETGSREVHWTPPDGTPQVQSLTTHHVVFREPGGSLVAEAWVYGDEVAVKGRVLRLSPVLNAAGLPNLFELLFAHNGWATAERHNAFPHVGVLLPRVGPLSVHPLWRPLQVRLLAYWERRGGDGAWAVRSATIESTYFALVDPDGKPLSHTYRLVLTPGGLTSS